MMRVVTLVACRLGHGRRKKKSGPMPKHRAALQAQW
jgi:hypothetical protein